MTLTVPQCPGITGNAECSLSISTCDSSGSSVMVAKKLLQRKSEVETVYTRRYGCPFAILDSSCRRRQGIQAAQAHSGGKGGKPTEVVQDPPACSQGCVTAAGTLLSVLHTAHHSVRTTFLTVWPEQSQAGGDSSLGYARVQHRHPWNNPISLVRGWGSHQCLHPLAYSRLGMKGSVLLTPGPVYSLASKRE